MVNSNGHLVAESEISFHPNNRGLAYGDAVFETLRVSAGKIFFWEDHYFRLMASMRILRMEIPMNFTMEYLEDEVLKTTSSVGTAQETYRAKILVWREADGKYKPESNDISFVITAETLPHPFYTLPNVPYEVELFKDHYVNSGLLSTLKTNNKVLNVLGSIYAKENDYANCLLLNEKKQVVEALNGNIFLVKGYTIKTPPLEDGCLNGILRKQIIKILGQLPDYILDETSVSPFELQKADELFITNVITGIQPVSKYRKKEYASEVAKELLAKLNVKARLG
ncbi:MAG: aminotransferase class IV [Flavobacteriales bacterium]|jgi:branched-chain amino acid aminotransferase|uniref:aminotransferase class IV n=1 Tax=Candidatus Ulvibacter alkanivorans TaxID=2267620 RepID=UPI000DF170A9|nr:aminotransferase class IV [Candidatus Ulvibacter alkanivorans]MCH2488867.1 aminotransferase class IV [Flavobacteriales bacterium]